MAEKNRFHGDLGSHFKQLVFLVYSIRKLVISKCSQLQGRFLANTGVVKALTSGVKSVIKLHLASHGEHHFPNNMINRGNMRCP